jgi:glycine hydroxymethyltransferase
VTSGIRIGTPAVTTRGFGEAEVRELAGWIADIIDSKGDEKVIADVKLKLKLFVQNSLYMQNNLYI